ncbi:MULTISPECIES: hypothetical protein [unclassified Maridesulfovibrio]|uniref:hypothetical protein n=1 Tax=unclassified Maridesulfovibrio TaxID=2794999 RepID=UPI003B3FA70F
MTFKELMQDIEKLCGLRLESIKSGADIRIEEIDTKRKKIVLYSFAQDKKKSRSFDEIRKIWRALISQTAVHVDSALGGSGSSRNQPETIIANLPYIEWLKYKRRKHLVLMESPTHGYGDSKQMDSIKATQLREQLEKEELMPPSKEPTQIVVVSGDISGHAASLEQMCGIPARSLGQGIYEYSMPNSKVLLVSNGNLPENVKPGTYLVLDRKPQKTPGTKIKIGETTYLVHEKNGLCTMFVLT